MTPDTPVSAALLKRIQEAMQCAEAGTALNPVTAQAGQHDEALKQTQANLAQFAEEPWVIIKSGDVYEHIGHLEQAEHLYRQGMVLAGDDDYTRGGAVKRLLPFLERMGRTPEVDALRDREVVRELEWKERLSRKPTPGTERYPPAVGPPPPLPTLCHQRISVKPQSRPQRSLPLRQRPKIQKHAAWASFNLLTF